MPVEKKTEAVSITVTKTQRAMVDEMAVDEDRSMASMLRILIHEGYAKREAAKAREAMDEPG